MGRDALASADARAKLLLVAVLLVYAATLAGLAAMDRATFIWKTAAVPVVVLVALLSGRVSAFVRDWAGYLGWLILFDSFRGLIFAAIVRWELPYYARYVIDAEHALLGGTTLPHILQGWWLVPGRFGVLDRFLVAVHASHFFFFLLFGLVVWRFRREAFARFQAGMLGLLGAGLVLYAALPTVPPWMAAGDTLRLLPSLTHVAGHLYGHDLLRPLTGVFDLNPVAAMPSLHAAFPAFCAIFAVRVFGRRGAAAWLYVAAVCVAIGYLGEHYLVDITGGLLLALVVDLAVHSRGIGRHLAGAPASLGPVAWGRLRLPVMTAVGAILAAELVGQTAITLRDGGEFHTLGFIERELVGRTPRGNLLLAEAALRRGDGATARRALAVAVTEAKAPRDAADAAHVLMALADHERSPAVLGEILRVAPPDFWTALEEALAVARADAAAVTPPATP